MTRFRLRHITILLVAVTIGIAYAQSSQPAQLIERNEFSELSESTEKAERNENTRIVESTENAESFERAEITGDSESEEIPDSLNNTKAPLLPSKLPTPKTTPVDIDRAAPPQPTMHYYDKHGEPLETPVRFLAVLDTVTHIKPGPSYPKFNGVSIGANFFDAIMMIAGQQRASFDVEAECSIYNWIFPVLEAGIGFSNAWPDDGRCHFKVKATPYVKLGLNYNFLYKSNPDYRFFIGLRAGWSTFKYDIYGIQPGSDYYISSDGPTQMTGLSSTAFYGQALAGLKVKIWRDLFMGWTVRYNFNIHQSYSNPTYPAWFTPGKGTATPICATFSIGWTFGKPPRLLPDSQ